VWNPATLTTVHVGYSRNFTPPPQELIAPSSVNLFNNTTKQSLIRVGDPVKAERENYFDVGVEQRFNGGLKLAIDTYYKKKRNLLDEGQFGSGLCLGRRAQRELHARPGRSVCERRPRRREG
jgi:outer membrane receptor protein involved in Fe transport